MVKIAKSLERIVKRLEDIHKENNFVEDLLKYRVFANKKITVSNLPEKVDRTINCILKKSEITENLKYENSLKIYFNNTHVNLSHYNFYQYYNLYDDYDEYLYETGIPVYSIIDKIRLHSFGTFGGLYNLSYALQCMKYGDKQKEYIASSIKQGNKVWRAWYKSEANAKQKLNYKVYRSKLPKNFNHNITAYSPTCYAENGFTFGKDFYKIYSDDIDRELKIFQSTHDSYKDKVLAMNRR